MAGARPVRRAGLYCAGLSAGRADGLEGFFGRIIRRSVRGEVQKGLLASLTAAKKKMESPGQ